MKQVNEIIDEVRLADEKDISQIADLYVRNWHETYSGLLSQQYLDSLSVVEKTKAWREYMLIPGQGIFVAVKGEKVVGFGAFKPYHRVDDCIYIDSLHVEAAYRGHGIGTTLIKEIHQRGKVEGYGKMGVCVVKGNDEARALYVKCGAEHYLDKEDDFTGETSFSEILLWHNLQNQ